MCGILCQLNRNKKIDRILFDEMRDTLSHRGPDGYGTKVSDDGLLALGHRRLSIIDLEQGQQPMSDAADEIWVSFNGEIYNYKSIRKELTDLGHSFRTNSDTEVLIHGYKQWQSDLLKKLKGMFAFIIWDTRSKQIFAARDRFGIKPLYYCDLGDRIIFASEPKAILKDKSVSRELDYLSVADFFRYRTVPAPSTIWKGIKKLKPAHYIIASESGIRQPTEYWKPNPNEAQSRTVLDDLGSLLTNSVSEHSVSDVPIGLLLSGGLDSNTIAHFSQNLSIDSFTIGFKDTDLSELEDARSASRYFGTTHHEGIAEINPGLLESLCYYFDEPFAGSSSMPTYQLCKLARRNVKVALSGDGGDELFAGYRWYRSMRSPNSRARKLAQLLKGPPNPENHYSRVMNFAGWGQKQIARLTNDHAKCFRPINGQQSKQKLSDIKVLQLFDYSHFLPEIALHKVDRASMANSLEVRVPFLDHELVEYVLSLSTSTYFDPRVQKPLLKNLLPDSLPQRILNKPKQGFGFPISKLIEREMISDDFFSLSVFKSGLINQAFAKSLFQRGVSEKVWPVLVFAYWYERWGQ
ncbi:MAG: asparagine synthase (glutamine-hydrolyzing) [Psychroserpens sp.]|nr:asparagine synthase (glutamine-hydrolyzing) [Psychroserpens sp.]